MAPRLGLYQFPPQEEVPRTLSESNSTETTRQTVERDEDEAMPAEMAGISIPPELPPRKSRRLSERGPAPPIPLRSSAPRKPVATGNISTSAEFSKDIKGSQNTSTREARRRTKAESSRNNRRGPTISSCALDEHRRYRELLKSRRNSRNSLSTTTNPSMCRNEDGSLDTAVTRTAARLVQAKWEATGGVKRVPVDEDGVPLVAGPGIEIDYDEDGKPLVVKRITKEGTKKSSNSSSW